MLPKHRNAFGALRSSVEYTAYDAAARVHRLNKKCADGLRPVLPRTQNDHMLVRILKHRRRAPPAVNHHTFVADDVRMLQPRLTDTRLLCLSTELPGGDHSESPVAALADDSAETAVTRAELKGHKYGVQGTPAWLIARQLILGLRSAVEFGRLAENAAQLK